MASGKESVVKVTNSEEKKKALDAAIAKLEKDFGKGAVMKLGESGAQICCGGVDTRQIHADTMESRLVPGVYFAGEIVDVDGICGGYNISFAVASGVLAGKSAATKE